MPRKPNVVKGLTAASVDILNTIRNSASPEYKNLIPKATQSTDSIREIGQIMMQYQPIQNEFLNALVNRIGLVLITSKLYQNPWSMFKRGFLEYGETVEEIFVNLAKPHEFDQQLAESQVFKREIPDVRAAFHTMNYTKFYKVTVSNDMLRTAFLSWDGITDLIGKIVDTLYTGANYDEFLTFKYLLAVSILSGKIASVTIPAVSTDNMRLIAADLKGTSNLLEFMSPDYNVAGVQTHTAKEDQFLIVNSTFDATMDVEVLATSFNMDKARFMGHRVLVDSFGALDTARLAELFADQPGGYHQFTNAELEALNAIPAVLVSRDWFMVFDNFQNFTQQYNGQGLYWNYWYHRWMTFSISPFGQAVLFNPSTPEVTSVTVSPATVTASKGQNVQFSASVVSSNFAPTSVVWSVNSNISTIDANGLLTIPTTETATTLTVTATSTFDGSKKGTATVTIS